MEEQKKKRKIGLVLILLVVLLLLGLIYFFVIREPKGNEDFFDPSAKTGILPGMSEKEIQDELNKVVEEGMLNISIASDIAFYDGASEGKANIYNVEANRYVFKVVITLEDGRVVYESKGIKPGQYIQYIKLNEKLEKGDYKATATFTAYTPDTLEVVGSAGAEVVLYIQN